jgi:hypothetical protein
LKNTVCGRYNTAGIWLPVPVVYIFQTLAVVLEFRWLWRGLREPREASKHPMEHETTSRPSSSKSCKETMIEVDRDHSTPISILFKQSIFLYYFQSCPSNDIMVLWQLVVRFATTKTTRTTLFVPRSKEEEEEQEDARST